MLLSISSRRAAIALSFACFGSLALAPTPCHAQANERKECADAYAEAQASMQATKLLKAREQLKVCARDACLPLIRKDCVTWLDEVSAGIPSVVVAAKGPDGNEAFDVRVSVDGREVASKLDVKGIELDPGTFTMRFEHDGWPSLEQEVVVRQGQKNKLVEVDFGSQGGGHGDKKRKLPLIPLIIGGVGIGFVGVGSVFWLTSEGNRSDLQGSCAPNCAQGEIDSIQTQRLVGDILFGVGIAAIGTAAVWLLTEPASRAKVSTPAAYLTPRGFVF